MSGPEDFFLEWNSIDIKINPVITARSPNITMIVTTSPVKSATKNLLNAG